MPFFTNTCSDSTCTATTTTSDWSQYLNYTGTASTITTTSTTTSGSIYYSSMSHTEYVRMLYHRYGQTASLEERDQLYWEAQNITRAAQQERQAANNWQQAAQRSTRLMGQADLERDRARTQNNSNDNKARRRARLLLMTQLSDEQRKQYTKERCFTVIGGASKTKYRIREVDHLVANVDVLDKKGRVTHRLCAHAPLGSVPLADQLLVQKTYLEMNEDYFLRTANRHAA